MSKETITRAPTVIELRTALAGCSSHERRLALLRNEMPFYADRAATVKLLIPEAVATSALRDLAADTPSADAGRRVLEEIARMSQPAMTKSADDALADLLTPSPLMPRAPIAPTVSDAVLEEIARMS